MTTQIQKENRKTFHQRLERHFSKEDVMLIDYAYDLAKEAHRTQKRNRGGRYFEHPRAGCLILMDELGLYDRDLLIAFLLHDVGEDTPMLGSNFGTYQDFVVTAKYRLEKIFGLRVSETVICLTKPFVDEVQFFSKDSELANNEDAILGKMVDRLHNLRSIPEIDKVSWAKKQVTETTEVYLPIFSSIQGKLKPYAIVLSEKIKDQILILQAGF